MATQTTFSGATEHPLEMLNFLDDVQIDTAGIYNVSGGALAVSEAGTPDLSVDVALGKAYLQASGSSVIYPVRVYSAAENVTISSNSSGNDRIDAIVIFVDLAASPNATATNVVKLVAVEGTPAASPTAPTDGDIETEIGASNPYLRLADVAVDNGETTILDADITDQRSALTWIEGLGASDPLEVDTIQEKTTDNGVDVEQINLKDGTTITAKSDQHLDLVAGTNKQTKITSARRDYTTNEFNRQTVVISGWGYLQGNGAGDMNTAITFPVTFAEAPDLTISHLGFHASAPTAISDFDGSFDASDADRRPYSISTTGFNYAFNRATGAWSSARYYGFSWIAVGVLA